MKVVAVNGSPRLEGNTYLTIKAFFDAIEKEGIETEMLQIGSNIEGCRSCGGCSQTGQCQIADEQFKMWTDKLVAADGIFLVAPVYFGSMPGSMKAFLDRFFYQCMGAAKMYQKVGASMAVLRRSGGQTTTDDLNRYFFSSGMIIIPALGSTLIHGRAPGEVLQDVEGLDTVVKLARNMAWILKMKEATKNQIPPPAFSKKPLFNFVR